MLYGIVMIPETTGASRPDLNLDSLRVYFLYEDHIGRSVLMSEYEDYDEDNSYFTDDNQDGYPYFHATYDPFGSINEDFDSTGIVVGNNNDTKITWSVPFRFPGQYQDPELEGVIFYNWNRYYSPAIGRYNRADPFNEIRTFETKGTMATPSMLIKFLNLLNSQTPLTKMANISDANVINQLYNSNYPYALNSPLLFIDPLGFLGWNTHCDSTCDTVLTIGVIGGGYVIEGAVAISKIAVGAIELAGHGGAHVYCDLLCDELCTGETGRCSWWCQDKVFWSPPSDCCSYYEEIMGKSSPNVPKGWF